MENKGADRKSKHSKSHAWFTKHNFLQLGKEIGYSIKKKKKKRNRVITISIKWYVFILIPYGLEALSAYSCSQLISIQ